MTGRVSLQPPIFGGHAQPLPKEQGPHPVGQRAGHNPAGWAGQPVDEIQPGWSGGVRPPRGQCLWHSRCHHFPRQVHPVPARQHANLAGCRRPGHHRPLPTRGHFRPLFPQRLPLGGRLAGQPRQFPFEPGQQCGVVLRRHPDLGLALRRVRVPSLKACRVVQVGEERLQRVKVALGNGVVLVVMTLGTPHRQPQPDRAEVSDPVGVVLLLILRLLHSPFMRGLQNAQVARRDLLIESRGGQQIASQLLAGEPVEGHILLQRSDHILPVGVAGMLLVAVVAHGVGIPHQVEPERRQPLAPRRVGERPINLPLPRHLAVRGRECRRAGGELLHQPGVGGQASHINRQSTRQRPGVGLGGRGQPRPAPPLAHKVIDRAGGPLGVVRQRGDRGPSQFAKEPVRFIPRPLGDPPPQQVPIGGWQGVPLGRGGHPHVVVGAGDALPEGASVGVARHNRRPAATPLRRLFQSIEPQVGFPMPRIGPVAGEAATRQQGLNLPGVAHLGLTRLSPLRGVRPARQQHDRQPGTQQQHAPGNSPDARQRSTSPARGTPPVAGGRSASACCDRELSNSHGCPQIGTRQRDSVVENHDVRRRHSQSPAGRCVGDAGGVRSVAHGCSPTLT